MQKLTIAVVGLCLLGTMAGRAEADPNSLNNLEIKIGSFETAGTAFNPNAVDGSNSFINPLDQLTFGLEYEYFPKNNKDGLGSAYSLSVDYIPVQRLFFVNPIVTTQSANQTSFPILVNYKYFWQASQNDKGYAGIGLGGFVGDYSGFAYSGFFGIQTGPNLDFELRYIGNGGSSSIQASQLTSVFGLDVGWHFR